MPKQQIQIQGAQCISLTSWPELVVLGLFFVSMWLKSQASTPIVHRLSAKPWFGDAYLDWTGAKGLDTKPLAQGAVAIDTLDSLSLANEAVSRSRASTITTGFCPRLWDFYAISWQLESPCIEIDLVWTLSAFQSSVATCIPDSETLRFESIEDCKGLQSLKRRFGSLQYPLIKTAAGQYFQSEVL